MTLSVHTSEMAILVKLFIVDHVRFVIKLIFKKLTEISIFFQSEWQESGKKKKKQKVSEPPAVPNENHTDSKPDRRDQKEKNDRDNRERNKEDKEKGDKSYREQSDNYRQRPRRNDNRPPRLSRGRVRPDRAGDRPERDEEGEKDDNKDRGFDRGRGRGRGFRSRGGRGGGYVIFLGVKYIVKVVFKMN